MASKQMHLTLFLRRICRIPSCCFILAFLLSWESATGQPGPAIRHVATASDTRLEVLDWGGSGIPIVFLAGLGHTAHVFDEFAPALTDAYRVLGITRRGFGASSQPEDGYDLLSLARDIALVLDSLRLGPVVLIGHSFGGDEISLVAREHSKAVRAIVYIDAAYNRITTRNLLAQYSRPTSRRPPPTDADLKSAEAFRAYYTRVNGVILPLSEIVATNRWTPDGRRTGGITPSWIYGRIRASARNPDYSAMRMPALAIYATEFPVTELFPDYHDRDPGTRLAMERYHEAVLRANKISRTFFRTHMAHGRVLEMQGAGHSLYLTHTEETLKAIRLFLAEVL